ncbi:MAG: hypothetical protein AVDCRST_MAG88-1582, partial [uncultured Thermomicrobiales bacterium]
GRAGARLDHAPGDDHRGARTEGSGYGHGHEYESGAVGSLRRRLERPLLLHSAVARRAHPAADRILRRPGGGRPRDAGAPRGEVRPGRQPRADRRLLAQCRRADGPRGRDRDVRHLVSLPALPPGRLRHPRHPAAHRDRQSGAGLLPAHRGCTRHPARRRAGGKLPGRPGARQSRGGAPGQCRHRGEHRPLERARLRRRRGTQPVADCPRDRQHAVDRDDRRLCPGARARLRPRRARRGGEHRDRPVDPQRDSAGHANRRRRPGRHRRAGRGGLHHDPHPEWAVQDSQCGAGPADGTGGRRGRWCGAGHPGVCRRRL